MIAGNIFLAEYSNYYGKHKKHFFYCIYSQQEDNNNPLKEDVIGLMITTNKKFSKIIDNNNDYNVKITSKDKISYVCCDKIFRFNVKEIEPIEELYISSEKKNEIYKYFTKFINESLRQLGGGKNE